VLDLGVGSGALLLAVLAELSEAVGAGIDASQAAVQVAAGNAERLGIGDRAEMRVLDWTQEGWSAGLGRFDLILANPPYVEDDAELAPEVRGHEPEFALFAGRDGLDAYRAILPQLPNLLADNGVAVVEIGASQAEAVTALATAAGLDAVLHRDLAGRPRAHTLKNSLGKTGDRH
jgi:release factor glutamine methyltransferase